MRKALALGVVFGALTVAASAAPITPFSFYGGYFIGQNFKDNFGNSIRMQGFQLGASMSLLSLPMVGTLSIQGSAVLSGSSGTSGVSGTLWRGVLEYKSPVVPGTSFYGIGGAGYYYAMGSNFSSRGNFGAEIGVGVPLKITPVGPGAAIEARYQFGGTATAGFGLGLNISF